MIEAELPENEAERLRVLREYAVLDTDAEQAYDDLTRIASDICGTPIALVSLVDKDRQWFKSKHGLGASETPREIAFCSHAIHAPDEVFVVSDPQTDIRFHDNPLVTGDPNIRFYAGSPLVNSEGLALGTLCVIDTERRELTEQQLGTLRALSRQVVSQLELRRSNAALCELTGELERSNDELRQFTSIASHDLQEPLRKLIAFGDLLVKDVGEDLSPNAAEDLRVITDASRRMQRLIADLLKFSRAGAGEIERAPLALGDCAHIAVDALSLRVQETKAEIVIDPLPEVEGDFTLLTQLFQNLIGNALKFIEDEQPVVRITCRTEDGETVVGVQDNGIGMDPKYADQIFAPFKRLHGRDAAYEGTGIGLAITRKVVERHGGRIWAESKPGEGSCFQFTLEGLLPPPAATRAA